MTDNNKDENSLIFLLAHAVNYKKKNLKITSYMTSTHKTGFFISFISILRVKTMIFIQLNLINKMEK